MRGDLRIASQRSPYLRAGLSWPLREPVELNIGELDGARFLELLRDPLLTMTMADAAGAFRPLPSIALELAADQAQMMIDAIVKGSEWIEEAPAPSIEAPSTDEATELREFNQRQADLIQRTSQELNSVREELSVVAAQRDEARGRASAAGERAAALEAEIVTLKAALAAKPKSHKGTSAPAIQA